MALHRLLHEGQCCSFIAGFRDEALEDFSFVIDGAPEVVRLAVDLHVHLIEMPAAVPTPRIAFTRCPRILPANIGPNLVHQYLTVLMAKVGIALQQQLLDIAQRQRKADVHHDNEADHFGRRVETTKRASGCAWTGHSSALVPRV